MSFTIIAKILPPLRTLEESSKLLISPDRLDSIAIIVLIFLFIGRTVKHAIGLGTPFIRLQDPNVVQPVNEKHEQYYTLPDLSLIMPLQIQPAHIKAFSTAINPHINGSTKIHANSAQLCLFLASITEPAMLLLLAKRGCPVRPLGAVNVRNRFELLEPQLCRALLLENTNEIDTKGAKPTIKQPTLFTIAIFPNPARRVRRGLEIDIEVSIVTNQPNNTIISSSSSVPSQPPSEAGNTVAIFRQEFTVLQFTKFKDKHTPAASSSSSSALPNQPETSPNKQALISVSMPTHLPYLWAKLCKDYNPIHFSATMAKLLGQPGQLAHGNHAVAVCVQAMSRFANGMPQFATATTTTTGGSDQSTMKDAEAIKNLVLNEMENKSRDNMRFRMEVDFRRPVVLPATFGPSIRDDGNGFDVIDDRTGKACVEVRMGHFEQGLDSM